jgi:hypothetical protein
MVPGRKQKPPDQRRNRMPHVHEWTEVLNVPFTKAPSLPKNPPRPPTLTPPPPQRPLGRPGLDLWERVWSRATREPNADQLQQLCEQVDERQALRVRVLESGEWRERHGLRMLDQQVAAGLLALADQQDEPQPLGWPAATKRWWRSVSRLPHAALWSEADWQFALDTACLVASFHLGDHRMASEIRQRERIMGTTRDARRDLRIRYVEPGDPDPLTKDPTVTAMEQYRRVVNE